MSPPARSGGGSARHQQLYGLDLVRFGAAVLVMAYHLGFKPWASGDDELHAILKVHSVLPAWWPVTWFGWIGVQVFFVLSGFVLAYSSEGAAPFAFIRSRILRLVPVMWISSTIVAAIVIVWGHPAAASILLWVKSNVFFPIGPWIEGQIWTLPIEIAFYSAILGILLLNRFRFLEPLAFGLTAAAALYWLALDGFHLRDSFPRATQLILLQHGCYFALGLLLWLVGRNGLSASRVVLIGLNLALAYAQIAGAAAGEGLPAWLVQRPLVPYLAWLTMTALIVASLYWRTPIERAIGRAGPLIRLAGLSTYPLYLLHPHVGGSVMLIAHHEGLSPLVSILLGSAAAIAFSMAVVVWVEPPVRRLLASGLDSLGRALAAFEILFRPTIPFGDALPATPANRGGERPAAPAAERAPATGESGGG